MIFDVDDIYRIDEFYRGEIDKLKAEKIGLKQKIDKAIEYIENHIPDDERLNQMLINYEVKELLSILRGEDNE